MFCSNCGKEVNEQEKFCRHCGATVTNDSTESNISFDVILTNAGTNQVETIKVIREETGMSLKEAKEIVDNTPKTIKYNVTKEIAEDIKVKLAKVGAGAELQHSIKTSNNAESQTEVKTEEKPKKKKSKKKTILTVVVVLFLLLAIAGSDDNQSTNTTVATSTNAVETENTVAEEEQQPDVMDGITEEDYIASNQERTDGEESQETETKENDKSFTPADEIFDNITDYEEDTTKNNNTDDWGFRRSDVVIGEAIYRQDMINSKPNKSTVGVILLAWNYLPEVFPNCVFHSATINETDGQGRYWVFIKYLRNSSDTTYSYEHEIVAMRDDGLGKNYNCLDRDINQKKRSVNWGSPLED